MAKCLHDEYDSYKCFPNTAVFSSSINENKQAWMQDVEIRKLCPVKMCNFFSCFALVGLVCYYICDLYYTLL